MQPTADGAIGRVLIEYGKLAWKHRRTIGKVGGTILTAGAVLVEKGGPILEGTKDMFGSHKYCRECEKHVLDSPLAEKKWVIARKWERCRICTKKTDR